VTQTNAPLTFDPVRLAVWSVIILVTLTLLVVGSAFLIPLAIATLTWILFNATREMIVRRAPGARPLPSWLATTLSILLIFAANCLVIWIIIGQGDAMADAIPVYEENFAVRMASLAQAFGLDEVPSAIGLLDQVNLGALLGWIGESIGVLTSNILLIAIYLGFLIAEENIFPDKISRLTNDPAKAAQFRKISTDIAEQVQRYVGMKTIISALTGLVSYVVLKLIGVDFAALWALLIFFLNFIPNIGSALGVLFPALLTLVQFDTLMPFFIVVAGLGTVEFVIGNVIEPAYMGKSLNMSSFMILLSLSFWGAIWGLPGMFLSVPLMVVTAIVCAHFVGLRWIAVMLSADGQLLSDSPRRK
jgi:predicted PurR-regulated permease PerM